MARVVIAEAAMGRRAGSALAPWLLGIVLAGSFMARANENAFAPSLAHRTGPLAGMFAPDVRPRLLPLGWQPLHGGVSIAGPRALVVPPRVDEAPPLVVAPADFVFAADGAVLPPLGFRRALPPASASRQVPERFERDGVALARAYPPAERRLTRTPLSPAQLSARAPDGGTPAVPRAVMLASLTPAPTEPEIVEGPGIPKFVAVLPPARPRSVVPGLAGPVEPGEHGRQLRCLAEAVYFEARSEPESGQAAVAQVVLNRVRSGLYPDNICGVVYQNQHRHLACQFTFACEGKALTVGEPEAWARATRIARDVLEGRTYLTDVGGATHYHAQYVRPYWSSRLQKMDTIGRHIFYKLKPGQT